MNKRFLGVLVFAFVVATMGGLLTYRSLLSRAPQTHGPAVPTVKIVVAGRPLAVGSVVKEGDVKLADWAGAVPDGASAKADTVVGRGVITSLSANEPVLESRLAPKGAGGGLAAMIPPGMRAVAVPVNEVAGVAGFVVPGMRVDVLISGSKPGGDGNLGMRTKTLLQNIEVLSAGQDFRKDAEGKPISVQVVNMLVTPEQAEQLSLARSQTTIQLVLRNPLDLQEAKPPGTALALLFDGTRLRPAARDISEGDIPVARRRVLRTTAAPAPAPKKDPFVMEIISGSKKTEAKFGGAPEGK